MIIIESRTKDINRPWPNDYNWITNQRYKVWTPQGRISDKFTVLKEPKEEQSLTFSDTKWCEPQLTRIKTQQTILEYLPKKAKIQIFDRTLTQRL